MRTRFKFLAEIQIFQKKTKREMRMIYFFLFSAHFQKKTTPADVIKFNALTIRSYFVFIIYLFFMKIIWRLF